MSQNLFAGHLQPTSIYFCGFFFGVHYFHGDDDLGLQQMTCIRKSYKLSTTLYQRNTEKIFFLSLCQILLRVV